MRRTLLGRALAWGLAASGVLGALAAAPAQADCVEVDFEVRYSDGSTWYPLGGPDYCVVPTDWEHMAELGVEHTFTDPKPGTPTGIWFHVWMPVP